MKTARRLAPLVALAALLAGPATARAALTSEADFGSKVITITGDDNADVLTIADTGTHLTHNINSPSLVNSLDFDTEAGVQDIDADNSWQLVINPGGGDDAITVITSEVSRVVAELGPGDDVFQGSVLAPGTADEIGGGSGHDRIAAGRAADDMLGGDGNDTLVWNNSDGSDEIDGQGGVDTVEVNGAPAAGDHIHVRPADGRLRVDRVNLGLFHLLIETSTERLQINLLSGTDTTSADPGVGALGVALELNGGPDDDTLTGSDGADTINGGDDADVLLGAEGDDRVAGGRGNDSMAGGDGDDTLVWSNGDASDVADGNGGFDTLAVTGGPAAETFTIRGNGARTAFDRTNVGAFSIDASAELLDLDALGGDDSATASGAPPILLDLDGGAGADALTGDLGNDSLRGGSGGDSLTGGGGFDVLDGDDGDDAVFARDDAADVVRCGAGADRATLDGSAVDAAADCESADRPVPAGPPAPPGTPAAPAAPAAKAVTILTGKVKVKKGRAAIRLQCPAGAATCRGRLSLGTLRAVRLGRARVVVALGSARYTVAPGKTVTVRVRLTKSLRAVAGRARSLRTRAVAATDAGAGATLTSSRTVTLTRSRRW